MKLLAVFVAVLAVGCVSATPTPLLDLKGLLGSGGDTVVETAGQTLFPALAKIISPVADILSTFSNCLLSNILCELRDAIHKAFGEITKLLSALGPLLDAVCVLLVKVGEALKCLLATVQEIANVSGDCTALLKNLDGCLQALLCFLVELVAEVVRVAENAKELTDKVVTALQLVLAVPVFVHDVVTQVLATLPCLNAVDGDLIVTLKRFALVCGNQCDKVDIRKIVVQLKTCLLQLQSALRGICGK